MGRKCVWFMVLLGIVLSAVGTIQAQLITGVERRGSTNTAPQVAPDPLADNSPCYVDRVHQYTDIPEFLLGAEYVMVANDDKNPAAYELDVTLSGNAILYLILDNRLGGGSMAAPGPVGNPMPWVLEMGFVNLEVDLGIDEGADGTIDQRSTIWALEVKRGTITLFQQNDGGSRNMYGVAALPSTPAGVAFAPAPEDEADDVPREVVLSWTAGEFAATHDVYLGTSFDDVNDASRADPRGVLVSQGQTATRYDPPDLLEFGATYYWRIDEVNAAPDNTIFKGNVWSFTAEPFAYAIENIVATASSTSDDTSPENTVNGSGLNESDQHSTESSHTWVTATDPEMPVWIQYEFDRIYKLYELLVWNYNVQFEPVLGFGARDVTVEYSTDGAEWTVLGDVELAQAPGRADYVANTTVDLAGVPARFVRLVIDDNWGTLSQIGLSEVRFLYIPAHAREPEPAAGAVDVSVDSTLAWRAGRDAVSHEVYFGIDPDALDLLGTTEATGYAPGALALGATYYWQVNAVQEAESWEGDLWSFATQEYLVVDDFESYTDDIDAGEAIFDTWLDGWVNDTGSTVGNLVSPFAEQTIVRSGSQSMPLFYDNTEAGVSEAELELAADWTTNGIRSLSLYFYGDPDNTGQLYVKINNTKVSYDGDADDLKRSAWQPWNIDLSAVGNVSNVRSLTIGIEGAGATGVVYIDDVRLYPNTPDYIVPVEPDDAGLVAYYSFDGNVNDGSGNGHHGTINGTPTYVAGVQGNAIDLNGTTDYVSTGKSASDLGIAGNSPRTVTVWVYTRSFANGGIYDVGARTEAQNFSLRTLDSIENRWRVQYWGGDFDFTYDTVEKWVHFAHVHDGTHTKIYANGALVVNWEKTIDTADTNPFQIGQYGWPGSLFDGLIDELRLYNRALSAEEVLGAAGQTVPRHKPF